MLTDTYLFTPIAPYHVRDLLAKATDALEQEPPEERCGTFYQRLGRDQGLTWAIACGVRNDGTIGAKVAFQPTSSAMQCDYDVDWLMPYDESGEVWNTDIDVSSFDYPKVAEWLAEQWKAMLDADVPGRQAELWKRGR